MSACQAQINESCLSVNINEFDPINVDPLPSWFLVHAQALSCLMRRLTNSLQAEDPLPLLAAAFVRAQVRAFISRTNFVSTSTNLLKATLPPSVMTQSPFCDIWHGMQAYVSRRRRRSDLPRTIDVFDGSQREQGSCQVEQEEFSGDGDLATHLRSVHQQYRAGLVSEKDFRKVKASIVIRVLRRRSAARSTSCTVSITHLSTSICLLSSL